MRIVHRAHFWLFWAAFCCLPGALSGKGLVIEKAIDPLGNDISGDRQIGVVHRRLEKPLCVSVKKDEKQAVAGAVVVFTVLNDDCASCDPESASTGEHGYATTMVTAGGKSGELIVEAALKDEPAQRILFSYTAFPRRWIYLLIMQLVGGFSIFFFGFRVAGKGLTKSVGGGLRELLYHFTKNRFLGMLSGIILSFLLQSSTAANVMIVGFLSAGLLSLLSAMAVGLGTGIGTTLTVQLIAFRVYNYSLLFIAIGFLLNSLKRPVRYYGQFILGFGLIFLGIKFMAEAFLPLSLSGMMGQIFIALKAHPAIVFFIAMLLSALVHSSAATIGIVISLSFQGIVELEHALPVILGANLGMSVTALVASIRGNRDARMFAISNFMFKAVMVVIFLPFVGFWAALLERTALTVSRQIANSHTLFNVVVAAIFLPLLSPARRLVNRIMPREREELPKGARFLDWSVIDNPAAAIAHAHREILRMCDKVFEMFTRSIMVFRENDKDLMRDLVKADDEVDALEQGMNEYLTRISQEELTDYQSKRIASLFFITDELEHIGDIVSKSLMVYAEKKIKKGFMFSDEGFKEIISFHQQVEENFRLASEALTTYDRELAERVREERNRGVHTHIALHNAHVERLKRGLQESIETSTVHLDLINDLERINFHLSNIGSAILGKIGTRQ